MLYTPYVWLPLASAVLLASIAVYAGYYRRLPACRPFRMLMWLSSLFSLIFALSLVVAPLELRVLLLRLIYIPGGFIAPAILTMVIQYTGHAAWITRQRLAALLIIPAVTVVLTLTPPLYPLFRHSPRLIAEGPLSNVVFSRGPWYWVYYGYGSVLTICALAILAVSLVTRAQRRREMLLLILGILIPFLADILTTLRITPLPGYAWTPMLLACTGVIYGWALLHGQIFIIVPIARGAVMDHIEDLVIVLDTQGQIADVNSAAKVTCGMPAQAIGEPVEALPPDWADLLRGHSRTSAGTSEVTVGVGARQRTYDLVVSTINDRRGRPVGHLFILHDVTAHKRAEEALRQSERRYRLLAENMQDVIWSIDTQSLRLTYISPSIEQLQGYKPEELLGQVVYHGLPPDMQAAIHGLIQQRIATFLADPTQHTFVNELEQPHKDGSAVWVEIVTHYYISPETGQLAINGVGRNISERRRADEALRAANQSLQAQLAEIQQLQAQLREQATHDVLTGLFNRRYMEEILEQGLAHAAREQAPLSVMMMDIDHFKQLNDTYGHRAGDLMLQATGALLHGHTRQMDTACRYGGEEFVVIMATATLDMALERADDLRQAFADMCVEYGGHELRCTISAGVASFPAHGGDGDTLLRAADRALYMAKATGRNRVCAADTALESASKLLTRD
ncbi:diguanylate cyclase [Oscillochloris sp. ZM17-4]|uniref:histidine kinase N-terminal 7TM domain-containing diguanylate cyclase n=1 Tax=Oscillochloris sp. ZM17-4 TaxID=2866714 RepID=UPI001C736C06|nr:diguanylate cyclase [Oscillochloris sp. ZM17-4]MBX0328739.1 diguanylate cyclase [Oscillochloris sp. ZM17-4]